VAIPKVQQCGRCFYPVFWWCIWSERNDKIFEDREKTMVDLKSFFFNTLFHWAAVLDFPYLLPFHDFIDGIFFFFLVRCPLVYFMCT
jgi:hypothetical protein